MTLKKEPVMSINFEKSTSYGAKLEQLRVNATLGHVDEANNRTFFRSNFLRFTS